MSVLIHPRRWLYNLRPLHPLNPNPSRSRTQPELAPMPTSTTLQGFTQWEVNELAYDPMVDLPRDGTYGLKVVRPEGLQAVLDVVYEPEVRNRWDEDTQLIIESGLRYAFKQWGRHFKGNGPPSQPRRDDAALAGIKPRSRRRRGSAASTPVRRCHEAGCARAHS